MFLIVSIITLFSYSEASATTAIIVAAMAAVDLRRLGSDDVAFRPVPAVRQRIP